MGSSWRNYCGSFVIVRVIKMFSENLTLQNKRKNIFLNLMCVCIVAFSYAINSFFIKPLMVGSDGIVAFFFINYFNDLGAGVMIAAFANILFIFVRQKYVKHILFYILLWPKQFPN